MPGLINSQMSAGRPPLPPKPPVARPAPPVPGAGVAQPAAQPGAPAGVAKADPVVTRIEIAAKKVLAQPKIAQQFLQMIQSAPNPAQGVALATSTLLRQLYAQSKGTMPLKALLPAAQKVVIDVARTGAAAKLYQLTPDFLKQAAAALFQIMQQAYKKKLAQQQQQGAQPAPQQPQQPPVAAPAAPPMGGAPAPMSGGM